MMNWLKQLLGISEERKSASIAKERLMVIVSHERGTHEDQPDFLPLLQKELTDVIAKYVKIDSDQVQVEFEQKGGRSILELNITLDGEIKQPIPKPLPVKKVSVEKPAAASKVPKRRGRPAKAK